MSSERVFFFFSSADTSSVEEEEEAVGSVVAISAPPEINANCYSPANSCICLGSASSLAGRAGTSAGGNHILLPLKAE